MTAARIVLAAIGFLGLAASTGSALTLVFPTEKEVTIKAEFAVDMSPYAGCVPCRVTIRNDFPAEHVWDLRFVSRRQRNGTVLSENFRQELRVGAGETAKFDLLFPILPDGLAPGGFLGQTISIDGPGVQTPAQYFPGNSGGKRTIYVGMTPSLATPAWGALKKAFEDKGATVLTGSSVNPAALGSDWRGWLCLDGLWLTPSDYEALAPDVRRAMREWIFQGGLAVFCLKSGEEVPQDFREFAAQKKRCGIGEVQSLAWETGSPPIGTLVDRIGDLSRTTGGELAMSYRRDTPFVEAVGEPRVDAGLLSVFVVAFAVIVGPVNLLWIARSGKRHRLFWTTPLISVAASIILALAIVLQDGFGGMGARVVFSCLLPGENRMLLMQEQASHTGVLPSRSFRVAEDAFVTPISIADVPPHSGELNVDGDLYSGSWFSSRAVQAQYLEAVVPTRQSIELMNPQETAAGAVPVLLSSIPGTLAHLYWIDHEGGVWHAESVPAGKSVTMTKIPGESVRDALGVSAKAGPMIAHALDRTADIPGNFYAVSESGPFLETLPSIRWKHDTAIFTGPVTPRPTP